MQTNPFFTTVVEVNPLFVTSDDSVQSVILTFMLEQIRAELNTSILICFTQLMQNPEIELIIDFYVQLMDYIRNKRLPHDLLLQVLAGGLH